MAYKIDARFTSAPQGRTDGYGVDHPIELYYYLPVQDQDDRQIQLYAGTCVIPLSVMDEIKNAPANQMVALYKQAIQDWLYATPVPEQQPPMPAFFDYDQYDEYIDQLVIWEQNRQNDVADCLSMATLADNFIQSQDSFNGYPFNFTMRAGD